MEGLKMDVNQVYKEYIHDLIEKGASSHSVRIALDRAIHSYRKLSANALTRFPKTVEKAKKVRKIKEKSINNWEKLVDMARESFERNHAKTYFAKTAEEANQIIGEIVGKNKTVVKGKSLTTEETHLRQYLQALDNEVYETDLGEFIIQLLDSRPMHLLAPAVNIPREKVADLLEKYIHEKVDPTNVSEEVAAVRRFLRDKFTTADVGISGANVIAAETGTMVIIENEGNVRLATGLPNVHIALVGIEKVVETLEEAMMVAEVTWRYADYEMPGYVNLISGPSLTGDIEKVLTYGAHGPRELHVVFLDNGRSEMFKEPKFREALYCLRCGACLYECPVYAVTAGYYGHQYIGGIGTIWDAFTTAHDLAEITPHAFTCVLCKRCKTRCPVEIDTADMMVALREKLVNKNLMPPSIQEFFKNMSEEEKDE